MLFRAVPPGEEQSLQGFLQLGIDSLELVRIKNRLGPSMVPMMSFFLALHQFGARFFQCGKRMQKGLKEEKSRE